MNSSMVKNWFSFFAYSCYIQPVFCNGVVMFLMNITFQKIALYSHNWELRGMGVLGLQTPT